MAARRPPPPAAGAPSPADDSAAERTALNAYFPANSVEELAIGMTRRLLLVARRYRKALDHALHEAGHSQARWEILFALTLKGGESTLMAVADRLGLEGPSLVGPMERLEADGFVSRTVDPRDRRSRRISLTDKGRAAVARMRDVSTAERDRFVEGIAPDDMATMFRVLTQLRDNLQRRGLYRG